MGPRFQVIIEDLATRVGITLTDAQDEHQRWSVYLAAADLDEFNEVLLEIVSLEPDPNVALGIVLKKIARIPDLERRAWIDRLPAQKQRDYANRRAREFKVFETRPLSPLLREGIDEDWSDWLQLRLAEFSPEREVAFWLSRAGRTKRIRRLALERFKILSK